MQKKAHDYLPADEAYSIQNNHTEPNDKSQHQIESNEIESKSVNDTEKTEETTETVINAKETEPINNESDWQKPISLKALKKRLNEIFVVK